MHAGIGLLSLYFPIVVFFAVAVVIAVIFLIIPYLVAPKNSYRDKLMAYECGFDAFGDARGGIDIKFYLIAILFIVFDIEVVFLFPWAVSLRLVGTLGFWSMIGFLGVLTIGLIYEWKKKALDWE
jgi:NADH-quinone oxidoreductase subunit A